MDAHNVTDPDKNRSSRVKELVADRMKEEEIRNKLVADEIVKMRRGGRAISAKRPSGGQNIFPTTTNQEAHNDE